MAVFGIAEHQVYLLSDTSHPVALRLHEMLKSTLQEDDGRVPAGCWQGLCPHSILAMA